MINVFNINDYNRNRHEREELLLLSIAVAGKTAYIIAPKIHRFIEICGKTGTPFERIKSVLSQGGADLLREKLEEVKLGCYNSRTKGFIEAANLDVFNCGIKELEQVTGVGFKTSRLFLIHTRPDARYCAYDVHIGKEMRLQGFLDAPKSTPTSYKEYLYWEQKWLSLVPKNVTVGEFDIQTWNKYSRKAPEGF